MSAAMDCKRADELLMDFLYQELQGPELDAFHEHLGGCARCAGEVAGFRQTREAVRALPAFEPSPAVSARLLHAAAHRRRGLGARVAALLGALAAPPWVMAAAAASVLIFGGVWLVQVQRGELAAPPSMEPRPLSAAAPAAAPLAAEQVPGQRGGIAAPADRFGLVARGNADGPASPGVLPGGGLGDERKAALVRREGEPFGRSAAAASAPRSDRDGYGSLLGRADKGLVDDALAGADRSLDGASAGGARRSLRAAAPAPEPAAPLPDSFRPKAERSGAGDNEQARAAETPPPPAAPRALEARPTNKRAAPTPDEAELAAPPEPTQQKPSGNALPRAPKVIPNVGGKDRVSATQAQDRAAAERRGGQPAPLEEQQRGARARQAPAVPSKVQGGEAGRGAAAMGRDDAEIDALRGDLKEAFARGECDRLRLSGLQKQRASSSASSGAREADDLRRLVEKCRVHARAQEAQAARKRAAMPNASPTPPAKGRSAADVQAAEPASH